jgi:hypothetical protein
MVDRINITQHHHYITITSPFHHHSSPFITVMRIPETNRVPKKGTLQEIGRNFEKPDQSKAWRTGNANYLP